MTQRSAFVVVCHTFAFKVPVGYFLIDGLGGTERGNLVLQVLTKFHSVGVNIVSLTFDGATPNVSVVKNFSCNLDPDNVKLYFNHPASGKPVCVSLDSCHMFKLVRNSYSDLKSLLM